ncbi:MAG: GNAT family N-acetyltransferase [Wenzhouxiangellaceae bacterium]
MTPSHELPSLQSERLVLRWPLATDQDELYAIFSNPEAMRYWSCPPYADRQQAAALIEDIHQHCRQRDLFQWAIEHRTDQRVIGTCTLAWLDWSNQRAEIGFILHPQYWRQGYISEALTRLLDHAFDDLELYRIEADVDPANQASIRTLERLGFCHEGRLRERWLVGGQRCDSDFYGLLKPQWDARRTADSHVD